jgi:hypothetical protein
MTDLELAQLVDKVGLWISLGVPVVFVWRFRWWGVAVGALFQWIALIAVGIALHELDPNRDAGLLDAVWLLFGWVAAMLYCVTIMAAIQLIRRLGSSSRDPISD